MLGLQVCFCGCRFVRWQFLTISNASRPEYTDANFSGAFHNNMRQHRSDTRIARILSASSLGSKKTLEEQVPTLKPLEFIKQKPVAGRTLLPATAICMATSATQINEFVGFPSGPRGLPNTYPTTSVTSRLGGCNQLRPQ